MYVATALDVVHVTVISCKSVLMIIFSYEFLLPFMLIYYCHLYLNITMCNRHFYLSQPKWFHFFPYSCCMLWICCPCMCLVNNVYRDSITLFITWHYSGYIATHVNVLYFIVMIVFEMYLYFMPIFLIMETKHYFLLF